MEVIKDQNHHHHRQQLVYLHHTKIGGKVEIEIAIEIERGEYQIQMKKMKKVYNHYIMKLS
jgi:hypothetical protein